MEIQENIPLSPLTTFKIGGSAKYFINAETAEDLGAALDYAETRNLPFFILAGGSNILVSDEGFNGVVIKINFRESKIDEVTGEVYAEAGCNLMEIIHETSELGLGGMESMYGIPGTVGGAVRGNAGAFGTEAKDVVTKVTALNIETRDIKTFSNEECGFSYRSSTFKGDQEWVILSATFKLQTGGDAEVMKNAEKTLQERNNRQIQNIKSAGSFFMNPKVSEDLQNLFKEEKGAEARNGKVPAGWLIEKSGFKGVCEGGVCTGERSTNYVINNGNASSEDVLKLTGTIKAKVLKDFGVELQEEVTTVGF